MNSDTVVKFYDQVSKDIADPRVVGGCLTGSERVGASIVAEAGVNLKKSSMELGGNDAFVILEDADSSTNCQIITIICPCCRTKNERQVVGYDV